MISLIVYSLRSQVVERSVQKAGVLVISLVRGKISLFYTSTAGAGRNWGTVDGVSKGVEPS